MLICSTSTTASLTWSNAVSSSIVPSLPFAKFIADSFVGQVPTLGVDFKVRRVVLRGTRVKLELWDTAGSERFQSIVLSRVRGAQGILVMFDVTDRDSYEEALRRYEETYSAELPSCAVVVLVGLKAGEAGEVGEASEAGERRRSREVSAEEARARAAALRTAEGSRVRYVECSARSGQGVEQAAYALVRPLLTLVQGSRQRPRDSRSPAYRRSTAGLIATAASQVGTLARDGHRAAYASAISASSAGVSALIGAARPALRPAAPSLIRLACAWDTRFGN